MNSIEKLLAEQEGLETLREVSENLEKLKKDYAEKCMKLIQWVADKIEEDGKHMHTKVFWDAQIYIEGKSYSSDDFKL